MRVLPASLPSTPRRRLLAGLGVVALVAAGCGSSSKTTTPATSPPTTVPPATTVPAPTTTVAPKHSGTVDVLSAGSLMDLMQKSIVGGFHSATGYTENDYSDGSSNLEADIKGRTKQGDVFVSASPSADTGLEGAVNGSWVSWYANFASSRLAIGYNPKSTFAAALKSKPWYDVVTEPGFKLGLTPPASDPKGVLAVEALTQTATSKNLPALKTLAGVTKYQFPETSLEGEVESGQLDAGFFYLAEADSAGIPTVPLTGVDLSAEYTVSVLNKAPHTAAAYAFVNYLLGPAGKAAMGKYGFTIVSPAKVSGSGVPAAVSGVIPSGS